jgi:hypothetical protein
LNAIQRPVEASKAAPNIDTARSCYMTDRTLYRAATMLALGAIAVVIFSDVQPIAKLKSAKIDKS